MMQFITDPHNLSLIFGLLFIVSEFLGMNKKIAANGVFQFIANLVKKGHEKYPEQK